jgi:DNA mismatch repair protein MSH3
MRSGGPAASTRSPASPAGARLAGFGFRAPGQQHQQPGSEPSTGAEYTPLEQQYLAIKQQHPDAILAIEVGYKYKFFGEDAMTAARVLNIGCGMDKNFVATSVPTHRLHVHVRRLVEANLKVGVVRQTETAALKAAGSQKSGPFERRLVGLYTKGTLVGADLGSAGDDDDEGGFLCAVHETDAGLALLAVNVGTGDLVHDVFTDTPGRTELYSRLVHLQPAELLVAEGVAPRTAAVVNHVAGAGARSMRVERAAAGMFDAAGAMDTVTGLLAEAPDMLQQALRLNPSVLECMAALIRHLRPFNLERYATNRPSVYAPRTDSTQRHAHTLTM